MFRSLHIMVIVAAAGSFSGGFLPVSLAAQDNGSGENPDCATLAVPDQAAERLFDNCCWLKCHDVDVTGWIEGGFAWREGQRSPDGFNGPDGFNDRDGELLLDQVYTTIHRSPKFTDGDWDWGFTVDLLVGTDARYPISQGLDASDDGVPTWNFDRRNLYGLAMPQAYFEVGTRKLSFKVGHWYTLLGNEVVPAIGNVFYSHTYLFLYGYPFTHTGALAIYKPNDQLTLVAGIDEGWDNFNDTDENIGYTGQATLTAADKHTTLTYAWQFSNEPIISGGNPTADPTALGGRFVNSLVLFHDLNECLSYVIENGDGLQANGEPGGGTASWFGVDGYVTYKLNCCWTAAARAEWFRDTDGTVVAPRGDFLLPNGNSAAVGGFAGNFYDITFGVNYHPNANVQIRPEVRYDWFSGQTLNGVKPYVNGTLNHQWISSVDVIWQY